MPCLVWFSVLPHFSSFELQSQDEVRFPPPVLPQGSGNSLRMTSFIQLPATPKLVCARNSNRHSCLDFLMLLLLSVLSLSVLWIASSSWHLDNPPGSWVYFSFWHHLPVFIVHLYHTVVYSQHIHTALREAITHSEEGGIWTSYHAHKGDMIIRDLVKNYWCIRDAC